VKDGTAYLRLLIEDQEVGSMPVPDSGWFLVPESKFLRVQLVAETQISFESRLPLVLIPRLGDLGRNQLIRPIRQMLASAGIDDSLVDWVVKLAQPSFRSWFGESLDHAIQRKHPMSPDSETPLISKHAPRTPSENTSVMEERRVMWVLFVVALLSIVSVTSWLGVLVTIEASGFSLSYDYVVVAVGCTGLIVGSVWAVSQLASNFPDVRSVGLATALAMIILVLLFEAPVLALSMIFSGTLIAGAYWVYVKRLLPELPAIDQPMSWLSLRLARDGVPSVRKRLLEVWDQASQWVIARIELVAEYSRFSRSVIASSLVIPAIASTDQDRPIVMAGLTLAALLLLERLRAAMPVSIESQPTIRVASKVRPLALGGEVQYEGIVYRRHAGGAPLFDQLSFHCADNSLVRITAAEGAGLSTLKHLLTREVSPERGLVRVGGMDVARLDPEVLAHSVIMLDHPLDSEVSTVGEWLFIESGIEPSTLEMHLQGLRVSHWIESLPERLNAPLGALWSMAGPLGTNRLKLARALSRPGQLMWLDHWLVGLDQSGRAHVIRSLVERSGTRFVVDRNELFKREASIHWELAND
jgi:ABC-type multidrug transport system fused ATPase/permease subunit